MDLTYGGHSCCSTCIGQVCDLNNRCLKYAGWSNELFDWFVKHRHVLEFNKLRNAKQLTSVIDQQVLAVAAHLVSSSTPSSVVNISSASSVSAYSPSAATQSLLLLNLLPQVVRWLLDQRSILSNR